jgi:hypothetical protein
LVTLHKFGGPGVRIVCDGFPSLIHCKPAAEQVSRADGTFFFPLEEQEAFCVHVRADGLACALIGPVSNDDVVLARTHTVQLEVGGSLLIEAVSTADLAVAGRWIGVSCGHGHRVAKRLDARGAVLFEHLAQGGWSVREIDNSNPSELHNAIMKNNSGLQSEVPFDTRVVDGTVTRYRLLLDD